MAVKQPPTPGGEQRTRAKENGFKELDASGARAASTESALRPQETAMNTTQWTLRSNLLDPAANDQLQYSVAMGVRCVLFSRSRNTVTLLCGQFLHWSEIPRIGNVPFLPCSG